MTTITDPQINDWWDRECRPIAEALERLLIKMDSAKSRYAAEISAKLAAVPSGDDLLDLRKDEGIPISSKTQILAWIGDMQTILTALTADKDSLIYPAVNVPV